MMAHKCDKEKDIAEIKIGIEYIKEKLDHLHDDVKENSEFRLKAKGIIGGIAFVCTSLGGFIMWIVGKIGGAK